MSFLNIIKYKTFLNFNLICNSNNKNILKNKMSIQLYYHFFLLKQIAIFCNILKKNKGSIKFNGYQYISPYWNTLLIKGGLVKVKKNNLNTTLTIKNHIETYYLTRTLYLNTPLIYNIINQKQKKINKRLKILKKKVYKFFL